ncbi:hypothetical protein Ga0123461_0714 [Mariprofundus aestuarium]|uniref:Uncharacterized protein n=1 Tax=Mariprofundus aestuarium TaxID=1921086 RepID=A0A2K8KZ07_MARES|nr:hypothetical protein [Mariprofundus aestuarium]ATX79139.1 hypothetical protein Ga0123461_0714 [Mariprofundus aestuarium]
MQCEICKVEMVAITKKNSVSVLGIIGVLIFLVGLGYAFANFLVGVIIMALGIFVGMAMRGEKLTMTCPSCGNKTNPVSL